jgi:hypothetical protein
VFPHAVAIAASYSLPHWRDLRHELTQDPVTDDQQDALTAVDNLVMELPSRVTLELVDPDAPHHFDWKFSIGQALDRLQMEFPRTFTVDSKVRSFRDFSSMEGMLKLTAAHFEGADNEAKFFPPGDPGPGNGLDPRRFKAIE